MKEGTDGRYGRDKGNEELIKELPNWKPNIFLYTAVLLFYITLRSYI
jgi:hypothetical protein